MQRTRRTVGIAALAALIGALLVVSAAAAPQQLIVVHQNDFHGRLTPFELDGETQGGIAHLAGLVQALRSFYPGAVLWLDGGDTLHGSTLANAFSGVSVVEAFSAAGLDGMVLGNHDFNYAQETLLARVAQADFAVVSANAMVGETQDHFVAPYAIYDVAGLKVAVLGLTTPQTPWVTHPKNVAGLEFLDPVAVAADYASQLENEADLLVALTHLGFDEDQRLAASVPELDLIVGGHSHTLLLEPAVVGDTLIVQAHEHGKRLGVLWLLVDDGRIVDFEARSVPVTSSTPIHREVAEIVQAWEARLDEHFDSVIGVAPSHLDGERSSVRSGPTNLGTLVAEAMRDAIGAEIGLVNGGAIRASIPQGPFTFRHVYEALPFDNSVVGIKLKGRDLLAAFEHSVAFLPQDFGGFLQTSGIEFDFDPARPPFSRVTAVRVGGVDLELDRTYAVAVSDFLAAGGDGYEMFADAPTFFGGNATDGLVLRDLVIELLVSPAANF